MGVSPKAPGFQDAPFLISEGRSPLVEISTEEERPSCLDSINDLWFSGPYGSRLYDIAMESADLDYGEIQALEGCRPKTPCEVTFSNTTSFKAACVELNGTFAVSDVFFGCKFDSSLAAFTDPDSFALRKAPMCLGVECTDVNDTFLGDVGADLYDGDWPVGNKCSKEYFSGQSMTSAGATPITVAAVAIGLLLLS